MSANDLTEYLRTRVSKRTKADFEEICRELAKTPTEQLREIVESFITREYGRLTDRVNVHIFQPAGYDQGAWRITIKLRNPEEMTWLGTQIPFPLPDLPKRLIRSDPEYVAIVFDTTTHEPALGGKFNGGEWRGHFYSNGCPESMNPTPISEVREAFTSTIMQRIGLFSTPPA